MFKNSILILILFLNTTCLKAEEWYVIIAKSCMEKNKNEKVSLKNIYLKKQRFIGNCTLSPLNLSSQYPMREYFSKEVLNISQQSWRRYYNEMHFKGVNPPHIVSSVQSMLKYLENINGAIGYLPHSAINQKTLESFEIILKFEYD